VLLFPFLRIHKPSQFLRHLRSLTTDMPDDFLRIWSARLPPMYRPSSPASPRATRRCSLHLQGHTPASTCEHCPTLHFCSVLKTSPGRWQHSVPSRLTLTPAQGTATRARYLFRDDTAPTPPTRLPAAGKLTQQTSTVAHICASTTGHLFITDRFSKQQFLVVTDSDLCVYPSFHNYNLCS
jgi:hypothetical protein